MATANKKKKTYRDLNSIKPHTRVDVYGVVKYIKQPFKTQGKDFCMTLSIVDPSLSADKKLLSLFFHKNKTQLPVAEVGDVVRFHRLNVSVYRGEVQGQSSPGMSWLLFKGKLDSSLEPYNTSSPVYTITDTDKHKIEELRDWSVNQTELQCKISSISEVTPSCYFNTVCQVVATKVLEDDVCLLLQVWDGSVPSRSIRKVLDLAVVDSPTMADKTLMRRAKDFIYHVFLFDDHFKPGLKIKPGFVLRLINVHAALCKKGDPATVDGEQPAMEIVLHRGMSFGRRCEMLPESCPEFKVLLEKLDRISPVSSEDFGSGDVDKPSSLQPLPSTSKEGNSEATHVKGSNSSQDHVLTDHSYSLADDSLQCGQALQAGETLAESSEHGIILQTSSGSDGRRDVCDGMVDKVIKCATSNQVQTCSRSLAESETKKNRLDTIDSGSVPTCMLKTCSVVLSRSDEDRCKIRHVLEYEARKEVGKKFLLRVKVTDYHPKADEPRKFLQLFCPVCKYLSSVPEAGKPSNTTSSSAESQLQLGSSFKGVPYYICPKCESTRQTFQGLESPPHLQYIYMMRLLVRDSSSSLLLNTWGDSTKTFFQGIEPEELLSRREKFDFIKECLNAVCPPGVSDSEKPWMECWVESYNTPDRIAYSMVDTVVV